MWCVGPLTVLLLKQAAIIRCSSADRKILMSVQFVFTSLDSFYFCFCLIQLSNSFEAQRGG
jgi:hypothetical protein